MRQEGRVEPEHVRKEKLPVPDLRASEMARQRVYWGPKFMCSQGWEIFWIKISARAGSNCPPLHRSISCMASSVVMPLR